MNPQDNPQHSHAGGSAALPSLAKYATESPRSGCCQSSSKGTWIDPVCGMTVGVSSPNQAQYAGQEFRFCSAGCRTRFLDGPKRYLSTADSAGRAGDHEPKGQRPAPQAPAPPDSDVAVGTIYTCPMHSEIRQIGPGHCPKCGMTLEPLMPTQIEDDSEIRSVGPRCCGPPFLTTGAVGSAWCTVRPICTR